MYDRFKQLRIALPLAFAVALAACASTPELDPRQLQEAQMAIEEAKKVNAGRHASGILARAEERLAAAHEAIDKGDEERARYLLDESVVLSELAQARALEADSELALAQLQDSLKALEEQIN